MADTIPGNISSSQRLNIGTQGFGVIDFLGDDDWWKVTLTAGYQYQIWLEGNSSNQGTLFNPVLRIYNAAGVFQHGNDDLSIFSRDAYTSTKPNGSGEFFLSARAFLNLGTGSYKLTVWLDQLADTTTAHTLLANSITDVQLVGQQDDKSDWYAVDLVAGINYQFDAIGSAADGRGLTLANPDIRLRNSAGLSLYYDDESGVGSNARLFYTPSTSGRFYLDIRESGENALGTYRVIVNASPVVGSLTLNTPANGSINFAGDTNLHEVNLTAGVTYGFRVKANTLRDPFLEIADSQGNVKSWSDNTGSSLDSYTSFTPDSSGRFFLTARSSGNSGTGTYAALVWQLPSVSISSASITETNDSTGLMRFTLTLSAASPVDVRVVASTLATTTATSAVDFQHTSGLITIPAGQLSSTFTVPIVGDRLMEPTEQFQVILSAPSYALLGNAQATGTIVDNDAPYSLPADPLSPFQWHLYPTTGVNVFPVWNDYTGRGVKVAVFDDGIDPRHVDLDANLLISAGRRASDLSVGGEPILGSDSHGTTVAGVIAAERNGTGVVGIAHNASLVSIYDSFTVAEIANALNYARGFDILNNSWGFAPQGYTLADNHWAFYDNFNNSAFSAAGNALTQLASSGRNGLGTIVVQAAGNSLNYGDDTNLHNFQNSQYIITVAGTDYTGRTTSYSSPGASILVAAPGGEGSISPNGIITTDRTGSPGNTTGDYTATIGTSFSAPIVSGVVALMLEANPNLGYRDVQEILAYSARKTGTSEDLWLYNRAGNWNGGGLHYDAIDHNLGFGLVDALAAVRLAETWTSLPQTAANRQQVSTTRTVNKTIPDSFGFATDVISVSQSMELERVDVTLKITHSYVGDLSIGLISPGGTASVLLYRPQQNALSAYGTSQNDIHFTFNTVLNWGENAEGDWRISVFDQATGDTGTLESWTLNLIGKPASSNDVYIYTNEFLESVANQPTRALLTDSGGIDTLNAAACTSDLSITLIRGAISTIDGAQLTMGSNTLIENAIGGDGNDLIVGNEANNSLKGMRGADTLRGGMGTDKLWGGPGTTTDIFDFDKVTESKTGNLRDVIYDFTVGSDKIDLVTIDANTAAGRIGNQAFAFSGTTATANSVWYRRANVDNNNATNDIVVAGDVNGDARADFEIGLVAVSAVRAVDFLL